MKNFNHLSYLFFILVFCLFIVSCKKTDVPKTDIISSENLNDYKFLNTRLKQFALDFAPALNNSDARNIIRNKTKQKFDQEYEVLIKDLFNDSQIQSLVSTSKSDALHNDLLKRSGEHIYPQIYIPHFQYLEDNSTINTTPALVTEQDTLTEDPIYVFYSGDPEVDSAQSSEIFPGYKLIGEEFVYFTMVDEEYANEHEVWVFSINESVNANGSFPCEFERNGSYQLDSPCGGGGSGGGGGGGGGNDDPDIGDEDPTDAPAARIEFPDLGHNKINFKISQMRVRAYNEHWLAGASEISIRAKLVCHNGKKEGVPGGEKWEYSSDQYSNYLGKLIKKVKRKDIKQQNLLTINYPLQTNWQNGVPSIDPVHFVYIMFERDIFPATKHKDVRYGPISLITNEESLGFPLFYRSQDKNGQGFPYARYWFTNNGLLSINPDVYAGSGLVENTSIAFNTVIY